MRSFLFITCLSFFILVAVVYKQSRIIISPIPNGGILSATDAKYFTIKKKKDPEELKLAIITAMDASSKNYSVLVKDLNSDFTMSLDDSVIYVAASINKVPILAALYSKINSQEIDPERIITMQQADIQDYGTGSMRYDPAGTRYSVKTMAKLMMKKSDNTAAYIIANHIVGLKTIQEIVTSWGMTQTDMYKNTTSNKDMALVFEKIFSESVAGTALTEEMRALLSDSDFEKRLPALLPSGTIVYHKIGTEVHVVHDVGIVRSPKATYYVGILIGDSNNDKQSEDLIAKVSKTIFDFMQ